MATYDIKYLPSQWGFPVTRYSAKSVKFSASFMQVATLTVTVKSATPIAFAIGDYIDYSYDGLRYTLRDTPTPKKVSSSGSYGEAFQYELTFKSPLWELANCPFKDYVENDNNAHFTSLPDVSTYEKPSGIVNRIKANIEHFAATDTSPVTSPVIGTWTFSNDWLESGVDNKEAKDFTLSNASCLDALNEIFNLWKLSYRLVSGDNGNTIKINDVNTRETGATSNLFEYGKGNGLKVIKKSISNADEIATRIYAYGNTTNLQSRYYNKVTYYGVQVVGDNMYIPNLMLPMSSWGKTTWYKWVNGSTTLYTLTNTSDTEYAYQIPSIGAIPLTITSITPSSSITVSGTTYSANGSDDFPDVNKAFVDDTSESGVYTTKYGVRPKTIYFDGSDDRDDIYPSIKGATIEDLRDVLSASDPYYPSASIYPTDSERIDEIEAVTAIADDGDKDNTTYIETETATETAQTITKSVTLMSTPFASTAKITMAIRFTGFYNATLTNGGKLEFGSLIGLFGITTDSTLSPFTSVFSYEVVNNGEIKGTYSADYVTSALTDVAMTEGPSGLKVDAGSLSISLIVTVTGTQGTTIGFTLTTYANSLVYKLKSSLSSDVFEVTLKQLGFDINQYVNTEGAQLSMLDGFCGGYTFDIKQAVYNSTTQTWKLQCYRIEDTALNIYYPNSNSMIAVGDHFVLLGIDMPDIYINFAEQKLLAAVQAEEPWIEKFIIEPEIDNLQLYRSPQTLAVGMWMQVYDTDLGLVDEDDNTEPTYILIDALTIDDSGTDIPKFSVTLRDEKAKNLISSLTSYSGVMRISTNSVAALAANTKANTEAINSSKHSSETKSLAPSSSSSSSSSEGGTLDHTQLSNRDAAEQHPISAITNLQTTLNGKVGSTTITEIRVVTTDPSSYETGVLYITLDT